MKAMVETHLDDRAASLGCRNDRIEFTGMPCGRLFDDGVPSGFRDRERDRGQHVVRGGDHHGVDLVPLRRPAN